MRDWLKNKYPKGIGLGHLIYEYVRIIENGHGSKEETLRAAELRAALDSLGNLPTTPVFSDEFGEMYFDS